MARRKVEAPYAQMRVYNQGFEVRVTIGEWGVYDFSKMWPASGLPADKGVGFIFDKRDGDLVDLWPSRELEYADGGAVSALADDAWNYAVDRLGLDPGRKRGRGGLSGFGDAQEVGQTIFQQFGGRRSMAMIGGQAMILSQGGLGIKWPNPKRSKGNYVEIILRPDDTYNMTFYNLTIRAKKPVAEYDGVYADQLVPIFEKQTGQYLSLGPVSGLGAGEETVDSIYIGNFGDVNPLEYHGFFVWWRPPAKERPKLVAQVLKGKDPARLPIKGGDLVAVRTINWCDASGECENEEKTLIEDIYVAVTDLYDSRWIDLKAVAETVGASVKDLKKDPIYAWEEVLGYYGAREFGSEFFEDSFKDAANFLITRGVPVEELADYLEG